jgi:CRISPR/Cas system-associated endoribonuclease Cas2
MALYLISYDIKQQTSGDYVDLYSRLESMKATHILESVYVVKEAEDSANEIARRLRDDIRPGDHLLVIEVTDDAAAHNLLCEDGLFNAVLQDARAGMTL